MGRELKRVPMDFDWPLKETWAGFLFHHVEDCEPGWDGESYHCGKAWHEKVPVPVGQGFQLWETTSEGSPISPVFETLNDLCMFAADNCTTFASFKTSAQEWHRMLSKGLVMTEIGPGMVAL